MSAGLGCAARKAQNTRSRSSIQPTNSPCGGRVQRTCIYRIRPLLQGFWIGARDGNRYPRPDNRGIFTPLEYVCKLNILLVSLLLVKIFTQWVNGY
jgi:hypothetical protein